MQSVQDTLSNFNFNINMNLYLNQMPVNSVPTFPPTQHINPCFDLQYHNMLLQMNQFRNLMQNGQVNPFNLPFPAFNQPVPQPPPQPQM